jgi:hypothetical protein
VRTSVVYDVDGVAQCLGSDLVGFAEPPASIQAMRQASEVHSVRTHRQRDSQIHDGDKTICLVRDGRDCLVSWARMASEAAGSRFETELRAMITRRDEVGTGSWGRNVLSWLRPPAPRRLVLRCVVDGVLRYPVFRRVRSGGLWRCSGGVQAHCS